MPDISHGDELAVSQTLEEKGHIKPSEPMSIETQKAIIKYENKLKAEIAKTTPMSKPSEKARELTDYIAERAARNISDDSKAIIAGVIEPWLEQYTAAELEAQHRKTWALAMETAAKYHENMAKELESDLNDAYAGGMIMAEQLDARNIRRLPCPPIEATKDK